MKVSVVNLEGKKTGEMDLNLAVFGIAVRNDIMARVVLWQQAKARQGTHATKTISDVSGTGKKPFKQKGTGGARQGTKRAAQHRGGGIVFGPVVRDHGFSLPKKIRQLGLRSALSKKAADGQLMIVDFAGVAKPSTKAVRAALEKMGCGNALIVMGEVVDVNVARSVSNIPHVDVLPQQGLNVLSILKREKLILTQDAIHHLHARLS